MYVRTERGSGYPRERTKRYKKGGGLFKECTHAHVIFTMQVLVKNHK